ncbi:hypothetical protein FIBSPDRAFT_590958 [Athelia psychrophila]|uniref:Uncharacterized protein n=1 Tax=Athelia psychrophila TaxID=1759441 RepID=A0A166HAC4_9AGAM|nr:hypothetical protein FIBSPDRAFT_590958 [Fibularhizoctonia sp. CBS 109695]
MRYRKKNAASWESKVEGGGDKVEMCITTCAAREMLSLSGRAHKIAHVSPGGIVIEVIAFRASLLSTNTNASRITRCFARDPLSSNSVSCCQNFSIRTTT